MIKSNSDHILLVDSSTSGTAVKQLSTMVLANSSGNLILSACKRNSLCTCTENENHSLNLIKLFDEEFEKSNCTEHQTNDTKKCKLNVSSNDHQNSGRDQPIMRSNNQQNNQNNQSNQPNNSNDNNEINQQQNNEDQSNNENNDENLNLNQFQMPNQMVDINNNIIEPELMLVDENNNLIGLPDANFDLNNNYIWNNNNVVDNNLEQRQPNNQQNQQNDQQLNDQQSNHQNNDRTSHEMNNLVKDHFLKDNLLKDHLNIKCKSNCTGSNSKSNCTSCKSTNHVQSVQLKQRKKLLELDLNKPRSSGHQFYSPMNEEENVIKEECNLTTTNHHHVFRRSNSSGRRKKSIHQCKKCLTKHLAKCDKNENCSKCEHYHEHFHSMDCPTPEGINESKKHNFKKATTPLTLCPTITTPTIKEQLITNTESELKQTNKSNLLEEATAKNLTNASLISAQCPICLFTLNEPCKPNNCTHSFCSICVIEWAKVCNN